jgi:hypothetical protein
MNLLRVSEVLAPWNPFHQEEAAERGRGIHGLCAALAQNLTIVKPAEELFGYLESFELWFEKYVESVLWVEKRLMDEKLGITGQPDILFKFKGKKHISLGDYKTGTQTKSWPIQLAAYRHLCEKAGFKIKECGNIQIFESGKQAKWIPQPLADGPQAWAIFLSAMNCARYFGGKNGQSVQD